MSYRDYYDMELTKDEIAELKRNAVLIIEGKLPAKKYYFEEEAYRDRFRYCYDRLACLKKCVKEDMSNPNPIDFLYPNNPEVKHKMEMEEKVALEMEMEKKVSNLKTSIVPPKRNEKQESNLCFIPPILAILLFISIFDLSYGFYQFLRIVVCLLSVVYSLYCYSMSKNSILIIVNIMIAIIWNPIIPIYLDKDTWIILDIIGGIIEVIQSLIAFIKAKR